MKYTDFGELSCPDAVQLPVPGLKPGAFYREADDIIINLTITGQCYARCEGCINNGLTFKNAGPRSVTLSHMEADPERDAAIVEKVASQFPNNPVVLAFYGGEPFLAVDKMERVKAILDRSPLHGRLRYMVYTNGEMLNNVAERHRELALAIWLYSVSIDGDVEQHNRVRPGTDLVKIIYSLRKLRSDYHGNILVWSTLRESQSLARCFDQFMALRQENLAGHFFWHWADTSYPFHDFEAYAARYGKDLEYIMDSYIESLRKGILLPLAHINDLVLYLLAGKVRGHTACAVEMARNFDVMAGRVYSCVDLPPELGEIEDIGNRDLTEQGLESLVSYRDWLGCCQCGVYSYCGGRCPVQALVGSRERTLQICQLMRLHAGIVHTRMGDIIKSLDKHNISLQDIYDRSAYITRYTDVVP